MIDHMATAANTQLPCFNSHFWEAGSEAVNTTAQDWCGENNWVVPPIALIPWVLCLLLQQEVCAIIVVPVWTGKQ